jgi:hypothetical protein
VRDYDWEVKVDRVLALYREARAGARGGDVRSAEAA